MLVRSAGDALQKPAPVKCFMRYHIITASKFKKAALDDSQDNDQMFII